LGQDGAPVSWRVVGTLGLDCMANAFLALYILHSTSRYVILIHSVVTVTKIPVAALLTVSK